MEPIATPDRPWREIPNIWSVSWPMRVPSFCYDIVRMFRDMCRSHGESA